MLATDAAIQMPEPHVSVQGSLLSEASPWPIPIPQPSVPTPELPMPTPLDRALQSKSAFLGFAGIVTAVAAWSIWYGTIFPPATDLLKRGLNHTQ